MSSQKRRKQLVTHFSKLYNSEAAHIKKFKWVGRTFGIIGWFILVVLFYEAFRDEPHLPTWTMVFIAFFCGVFFSFHTWFKENILQWPIFQEFLNREKIEKAAKEYEKPSDS